MTDQKGRDALRYLISSPGELEKFAAEIFSFLHENKKLLPLLELFFNDKFSIITSENRREIKLALRHFILCFQGIYVIHNTIAEQRRIESIIQNLGCDQESLF